MKRGIEFLLMNYYVVVMWKIRWNFFNESKKKNLEFTLLSLSLSLSFVAVITVTFEIHNSFIIKKNESWDVFSLEKRKKEKNVQYLFPARWNSFSKCDYRQLVSSGTRR